MPNYRLGVTMKGPSEFYVTLYEGEQPREVKKLNDIGEILKSLAWADGSGIEILLAVLNGNPYYKFFKQGFFPRVDQFYKVDGVEIEEFRIIDGLKEQLKERYTLAHSGSKNRSPD